jgi:hypothetical protein
MTNEYLATRYGDSKAKARKQRVFWTSVGAILVVAFFAWSIAVNFAMPAKMTATIQNFSVTSELQTRVTINASNETTKDGFCAIKVLNQGFSVVGYKEVAIAGRLGKNPEINSAVNTTDIGVSASVDHCWFK